MDEKREPEIMNPPSTSTKILFWIILGCLSTFFAEVISGSYPYPFTTFWGLLFVYPLYTLHILVLVTVIYRYGKPSFSNLFVAGCIFGMYEAYITKVLWSPPWAPDAFRIGGIAVSELLVIAFFWHPFMSFIIPVIVGGMLNSTRPLIHGLPRRWHGILMRKETKALIVLAVWAGLIQGSQIPFPDVLISIIIGFIVIGILIWLFKRKVSIRRYEFHELLPKKKGLKTLLVMLYLYYAITIFIFSPEKIPGLIPQTFTWSIYMFLFALLYMGLKKSGKAIIETKWSPQIDNGNITKLFVIYVMIAVLVSVSGLGLIFLLISWIIWGTIAVYSLAYSSIYVSKASPREI